MQHMRITSKGQITIPIRFRAAFHLTPDTQVEFIPLKDGVKIVRSRKELSPGKKLVAHLRGRGNHRMTTAEIMRLTRGE